TVRLKRQTVMITTGDCNHTCGQARYGHRCRAVGGRAVAELAPPVGTPGLDGSADHGQPVKTTCGRSRGSVDRRNLLWRAANTNAAGTPFTFPAATPAPDRMIAIPIGDDVVLATGNSRDST